MISSHTNFVFRYPDALLIEFISILCITKLLRLEISLCGILKLYSLVLSFYIAFLELLIICTLDLSQMKMVMPEFVELQRSSLDSLGLWQWNIVENT